MQNGRFIKLTVLTSYGIVRDWKVQVEQIAVEQYLILIL